MSNLLKGIFSTLGSNTINLIINIITIPILVRLLGRSGYGDFAFMTSFLGIAIILVNFGTFDSIRKFIGENSGDDEWTNDVFSFYLQFGTLLWAISALIICITVELGTIPLLLGPKFSEYFYIAVAILFTRQLFMISRGTLMGFNLEHISEPITVVQRGTFAISSIILIYYGYGVSGALVAQVLGFSFASLLGYNYLNSRITFNSLSGLSKNSFPVKRLLSFNTGSISMILLFSSLYNVDILLLKPYVGSELTGVYKASLVIAEFIWFIPFAVQMVLLQRMSKLWSRDKHDEISDIASKVTRYTLSFGILIAIGLAILANDFVPIYFGDGFGQATTAILILLPGSLGFAVARPIISISQGKGQLTPLVLVTTGAAGLNLILNLILIPRYGIYGAAIATSIGYGSMAVLHIRGAQHIGYNPIKDLRFTRIIVPTIIVFSVVFLLDLYISSTILKLIVIPPSGFVTFTYISIKSKLFEKEDILHLKSGLLNI